MKQETEWVRGRLLSTLFGTFSVLALLLTAVGLYSVVSYSVAQRANEFGIRVALGAQRTDIFNRVLTSAGISVSAGLFIGLALSLSLNRLLNWWIGNTTSNPWMALYASIAILIVALFAWLVPGRRTASIDPTTALRCD
jgi:ABC-type antimicrobial peptide transport system permease subunit